MNISSKHIKLFEKILQCSYCKLFLMNNDKSRIYDMIQFENPWELEQLALIFIGLIYLVSHSIPVTFSCISFTAAFYFLCFITKMFELT